MSFTVLHLENGRAYPEYLVRYYIGDRDRKRSPYASVEEARKKSTFVESAVFFKSETVKANEAST